jgi:hypothetical protein
MNFSLIFFTGVMKFKKYLERVQINFESSPRVCKYFGKGLFLNKAVVWYFWPTHNQCPLLFVWQKVLLFWYSYLQTYLTGKMQKIVYFIIYFSSRVQLILQISSGVQLILESSSRVQLFLENSLSMQII